MERIVVGDNLNASLTCNANVAVQVSNVESENRHFCVFVARALEIEDGEISKNRKNTFYKNQKMRREKLTGKDWLFI